ncbi:MAG: N-acyl-D-amino-acid deacylase family protein [Minwuia sp.]|uniref:N-acyl-D-amino-acid deacylase family protein n=1 Tax=Minwuia sp. TaxID=2493630 RepID=UPI003A86E496
MHDLVIRGGTIVDGTGKDAFTGDIAIADGRIAEVGGKAGPAKRDVEANGALVTPGWVDIHTHYDGQATWDSDLTPSAWHGVTTTVFGNCGVGFAPVKPGTEPYLINLMEGVEDIPEIVLSEGIDFRWESFPDFMNVLGETPRTMDIGTQVPHAALRYYVMGDRGADYQALPTEDEIKRMGQLLEEGLAAGAMGFSTSRTIKHKAADGRYTPSLTAREAELFGMADAMRRAGKGVLQVNSDFEEGDFDILRAAAERAGRPLSVLLIQVDNAPDRWKQTLDGIHRANAAGVRANGQVGTRPIGILMGLETSIHPFITHRVWRSMADLTPAERYQRLKNEPELRRALIDERPQNGHTKWMELAIDKAHPLAYPLNYEPEPQNSVGNRAKREGRDKWEAVLDAMMDQDGKAILLYPFENYFHGDLEVVRELMMDEHTVCGVADGGAHVGLICDSSAPTTLLTHWGRDRKRGEHIPLPYLVKKQTHDTARAYGMTDRGTLEAGMKADVNVIDFDNLAVTLPQVVYDLPAGGRRLIQRASGYRHTFKAGIETISADELTGARPGGLIRG